MSHDSLLSNTINASNSETQVNAMTVPNGSKSPRSECMGMDVAAGVAPSVVVVVCTRVARRREVVVAALPVGTTTVAGLGMKTWRTGPTCENNSQRISSVTSGWRPFT